MNKTKLPPRRLTRRSLGGRFTLAAGMAALAMAACLVAGPAWAAPPIGKTIVVAVTGDPAPDGDTAYVVFGPPSLNDVGQVAFAASFAAIDGGPNELGIFRGNRTAMLKIAQRGQEAPDGNGILDNFFLEGGILINDVGDVALLAAIRGGVPFDNYGIFRGNGSELVPIVRGGDLSPDGTSRFTMHISGREGLALNNAGQVAFASSLDSPGDVGIFRGDGTTMVQIARNGQVAPDGSELDIYLESPQLNDAGEVGFYTNIASNLTSANYKGNGETIIPIARVAQEAHTSEDLFIRPQNPSLNESGQAAFFSTMGDTSAGIRLYDGLYVVNGTTVAEIAHWGQIAPDGNGTLNFSMYDGDKVPALNEAGQVVFRAGLTGTSGGDDNQGIFRGDGTTLIQVAREGQTAPDGNGIITFPDRLTEPIPVLNDAGHVAFAADVIGTVGGSSDGRGLFLFDDHTGLLQIAREGDSFLGSTITRIFFGPNHFSFRAGPAHEQNGLNKTGQTRVAYSFFLANGRSGIAIWSLVPEPEAGALVLAAVGCLGGCRRRRRAGECVTPAA
jgi:hypothetical protein